MSVIRFLREQSIFWSGSAGILHFRSRSVLASQRPSQAQTCIRAGADGIIVGSAIVEIVERNLNDPAAMEQELKDYVSAMKKALVMSHPV